MWLTNSNHIARRLQKRCSGGHPHEPLTGGGAALAAVYPPLVCKAIVAGLKRHLQEKYGGCALITNEDEIIEVSTFAAPVVAGSDEGDQDAQEPWSPIDG